MRGISLGVCIGLIVLPSAAIAGAWTLPEGRGQLIVTLSGSSATRAFSSSGLAPIPRYNKFELQSLIEYGITNRLTLLFAPTLQHVTIAAPTNAQRAGLGHTEIGARYQVYKQDNWVLSGQATVRVPGTRDTVNPAAIGHNEFETDLRVLAGHTFRIGAMPAFIDLQFAQRFFESGPPGEFRADLTFGIQPASRWVFLAQSFNVVSEGAGGALFPSYGYYKLQLSGVYAITPSLAVQAGGFTAYAGRNALQENGGIVGFWYRF